MNVDALMWDAEAMTQNAVPDWMLRPGTPAAYVVIYANETELNAFLPLPAQAPTPTLLKVSAVHHDDAVDTIAAWLEGVVIGVTIEQREMLEVVVTAVRRLLDDDTFSNEYAQDDIAQAEGACETIETQLRVPRPSRRVLKWALGQLNQFPGGVLSGAAVQYLPALLHHL